MAVPECPSISNTTLMSIPAAEQRVRLAQRCRELHAEPCLGRVEFRGVVSVAGFQGLRRSAANDAMKRHAAGRSARASRRREDMSEAVVTVVP